MTSVNRVGALLFVGSVLLGCAAETSPGAAGEASPRSDDALNQFRFVRSVRHCRATASSADGDASYLVGPFTSNDPRLQVQIEVPGQGEVDTIDLIKNAEHGVRWEEIGGTNALELGFSEGLPVAVIDDSASGVRQILSCEVESIESYLGLEEELVCPGEEVITCGVSGECGCGIPSPVSRNDGWVTLAISDDGRFALMAMPVAASLVAGTGVAAIVEPTPLGEIAWKAGVVTALGYGLGLAIVVLDGTIPSESDGPEWADGPLGWLLGRTLQYAPDWAMASTYWRCRAVCYCPDDQTTWVEGGGWSRRAADRDRHMECANRGRDLGLGCFITQNLPCTSEEVDD